MSDEQQSSEHTRDLGAGHVDGELKDLAISLASSKEAMGVLGSALADHVVGALQAQGLMPGQVPDRGGQPATQCTHVPNQVMGWGFATPFTAEQTYMQQAAGGVMPPFFPPTWPRWPYNAVHGQGFVGSDPTGAPQPSVSPFSRLGPPLHTDQCSGSQRSHHSESSSQGGASASCFHGSDHQEDEREEGSEGDDDIMSLHHDWDIDLEPGQSLVDDQLEAFLKQCVGSPHTNQQRRRPWRNIHFQLLLSSDLLN